jgi:hypothetical protein
MNCQHLIKFKSQVPDFSFYNTSFSSLSDKNRESHSIYQFKLNYLLEITHLNIKINISGFGNRQGKQEIKI